MKKLLICVVLSLFAIGFLSAQEMPKITIVNNTGYDIYEIFASPEEDDDWGDDWLPANRILRSGQSFEITLLYPLSQYNVYDIMLIDEDDDAYLKWGVRITANARIVFTFDDIDWDY